MECILYHLSIHIFSSLHVKTNELYSKVILGEKKQDILKITYIYKDVINNNNIFILHRKNNNDITLQ